MNTEQLRAEFEAWYADAIWGNEDFKQSLERAYQAGRAALQSQPRQPEISRDLLGKIVDEVFDGAIEDASVIEDIYRVVARECALQSQDAEDAERFRFCLEHGFPQKWEEMIKGNLRHYWTSRPGSQEEFSSAIEAIDHARRGEGADDA